jgi:eukaryotic-like serine/threonine-protein kinase
MTETTGAGRAALDGDLVGGRYRLREILGVGGMGRVWLAEDELLRRPVAVKEMLGPAADRVDIQLRTVREARAAARLDHPAVVKVYDVVWRAERAWIVMEYVRSRSLHLAVRTGGPLPEHEAARIGLRVLGALRAAHTAGVLHLDVKPQNVLLAEDGRVVLGDFGLAVTTDPDGGPDAVVMGSPYYVAPERITPGEPLGADTDLWSLGATLYTAIQGRPPFARSTVPESLRAVLNDEPDPIADPGPLAPVVLDLLAKDRDDRPDAADLERRLRWIVQGAIPHQRQTVAAMTQLLPIVQPRKPRRRRYVLAGAAVVLAGAVGTAIALDDQRAPAPAPAAIKEAPATTVPPAPACGPGATADPVAAATTRIPAGLPAGWVWFRDPTGFALALPPGWRRSMSGTAVCFQNPAGDAAFTVDSAALVTRRPLDYFQAQERTAKPAGYQRISMDLLLLRRGGADWEYTWRPDSDTVQHVRRVLLAVTDRRSYLLKWSTPDAQWAANDRLQRQLVTFFDSAA